MIKKGYGLKWIVLMGLLLSGLMADATEIKTKEAQWIMQVVGIEGRAKVLPNGSIKKHTAKPEEKLHAGDRLITYAKSLVRLKLPDGSDVIVDASSELQVLNERTLEQVNGDIYYRIEPRHASRGLQVKTPFSIMGIKGTEFIVSASGNQQIALNEGRVGISALHEAFELHKAKVIAAYEKYKQEQEAEYEAFKAEAEGKVVSYVKAFDLEAGHVLNFNQPDSCQQACEKKVDEETIDRQIKERFTYYQTMITK